MALTQIDDRGLKTPIDLQDNEKIRLGTGNDLELYHDTENYIKSATASVNLILESAHDVYIKHGGENMLKCTGDGAVDLYHDNSLKFETTSSGTRTTGAMHINDGAADSNRISVGNGGDLKIFHTNPTTFIQDSSTALVINSARLDINNAADNEQMARFNQDGAVELYHNNIKKFDTITTGIRVHGDEGGTAQIHFAADEGDDNPDYWRIIGETSGPILNFQSYNSGNWTNNLRMTGDQGCELYYNNGVKFQTTSAGATLTGDVYATGKLGIGTGASTHQCASGGLDLRSVGATDKGALFIGADAGQNSMSRSSNTEKQFRMMMPSYADPDKGITVLYGESGNTEQLINYGGATGWAYAINGHRFYAASNTTTATGSLKATIDSDGLKFNGDTSSANALDDYEEGTFTPLLGGSNYGSYNITGTGKYTKIGRLVTFQIKFVNQDLNNSASGDMRIRGWPVAWSTTDARPVIPVIMAHNVILDDGGNTDPQTYCLYGDSNGIEMYGLISRDGTSWNNWSITSFESSGLYLDINGSYMT
mgnify:CR=1 FL=1